MAMSIATESKNARQGIKTPIIISCSTASRTTESKNARQGIKTSIGDEGLQHFGRGTESKNARQGIKTRTNHDESPQGIFDRIKKCPSGH